ncbi:TlpA family protein disulfide reductase [Simplicispira hankyongi]|uniref:TlpA family protein disulfide reductase n=1 Tax=Simplicispira hankyongi TaxID=2315688 RepID=UPI001FE97754|nr:TlpA disulfide reductase family protein [Simplicispira hankyongi]
MTDSEPSSAVPAAPDALRRRLLYAGVAGGAALAGAGWAWWRLQPHAETAAAQASDAAFFAQSFETPEGAPLSAQAFRGKPLLLNFWATWCPPCIAELPLLNQFFQEHQAQGWQILGLAVDQPSAVRKFLERRPVSFPIGMAGLGGTELSRSLGNLAGGLPFTVVFAADGRVLHRKIGQIKPQELVDWVAKGAVTSRS